MNIQETKLFSGTHASVRHLPPPAGLQHSSNSYIRIQPSITKDLYNEGPCFMFKPFLQREKKKRKHSISSLEKGGKSLHPCQTATPILFFCRRRTASSLRSFFCPPPLSFFLSPLHTAVGLPFAAASRRRQGEAATLGQLFRRALRRRRASDRYARLSPSLLFPAARDRTPKARPPWCMLCAFRISDLTLCFTCWTSIFCNNYRAGRTCVLYWVRHCLPLGWSRFAPWRCRAACSL